MNTVGLNNLYMPFCGCGCSTLPMNNGFSFPLFPQTPRYSVFDNNIFGFTPPTEFCAMPQFGYTTPNAFLQPLDFMSASFSNPFGFSAMGLNPFMGCCSNNPFMNFTDLFSDFMSSASGIGCAGVMPGFSPINMFPGTNNFLGITSASPSLISNPVRTSGRRQTTPSSRQQSGNSNPSVAKAVELANSQVGVREIGSSNDSEQIRKYKNGAVNNNPWCCSFVSWLYGAGQNSNNSKTFGYCTSSLEVRRRAESAGCYAPKNSGYTPKVGDLVVFDHTKKGNSGAGGHIGIVTKVNSDGTFETVEGNYSNKVSRVHRSVNSADFDGFVKMNEWLNA